MQPSKAMKRFTGELGEGQSKPMRGYLGNMVYGIATSHSAMLSEIGRALGEESELITTEMRLSRNLANRNMDEESIRARYLGAVKPFVQDGVVALDFSDIRKEYSKKQEWLCGIWDDTRKEKAQGYWLLDIEAIDGEGRHFPLWLEPFSQNAPGYESQAATVKKAVRIVSEYTGKDCAWVLDRGFDGANYIGILEDAGITYAIRQTGRRHVITETGEKKATADVVSEMEAPHIGQWHYSQKGREYPFSFRYGSAIVTFPSDGKQRQLIAVYVKSRTTPLILLTNSLSTKPASLLRFIIAYFKRWGVEEGIRVVKQIFDLENVRAMSFAGIRRLTLFAYLAYGFLCLFAKRLGKEGIRSVLKLYKSFGETPHFLYYRLAQAVALALLRAGP